MDENKKEMWALVELFGHNRIAGRVSEAEIGAGSLIRVDVPQIGERAPLTKYYNVKSIYGITPVDEETALRMAKDLRPEPVSEFSLTRELDRMRRLSSGSAEDDGDDGPDFG
ncbi:MULTISPECIES: hypothetical protein [Acidobacterium]|uniref:hypothetical protein n=1 Tax=Acidobacterium TaxID=33973 RepID=UPI0002D7A78D|nr:MULTISPECIES: hypothetical protein [Acidobacterium]HCT62061.1 hypothetical protein [Acidobacterium sp.]